MRTLTITLTQFIFLTFAFGMDHPTSPMPIESAPEFLPTDPEPYSSEKEKNFLSERSSINSLF